MNKLREGPQSGVAIERDREIRFGSFVRSAAQVFCLMSLPSFMTACPLCHTQTGQQVRAGIFDGRFPIRLLLTAAPFPVLAGIVAVIYTGKPRFRRDRP